MRQTINFLALLLLANLSCFAQYTYERKISDVTQPGWYRITLPDDVFPKVKNDFADLRIYASSNDTTEIPYLLKISEDQVSRASIAIEPFNISRNGNALYFTVKVNHAEPVNQTTLEFTQQNYDSDVLIEGSNNQQDWFIIHTGRIVSIVNSSVNYTYNHVNFPTSDYIFLRFTLKNGAQLTLTKVNFYQSATRKGVFTEVPATLSSKTLAKQNEFYLTFNQPVLLSKLTIEPNAGQLFYRNVSVEWLYDSIPSEKGIHYQYQSLYVGVISSFQQDTLQFTPRLVGKIRVTIYNQDNPPIHVNKIVGSAPQVDLIANLQPGGYSLKYGNPNSFHPRYDIKHFIKDIPDSLPQLQVSTELKPQHAQATESTAWFKNKVWMWVALGAIVAILGFFTMRMLREK